MDEPRRVIVGAIALEDRARMPEVGGKDDKAVKLRRHMRTAFPLLEVEPGLRLRAPCLRPELSGRSNRARGPIAPEPAPVALWRLRIHVVERRRGADRPILVNVMLVRLSFRAVPEEA